MKKPLNIFILNTRHDSWEINLIKEFKRKELINTAIVQKTSQESKQIFLNLGSKGLEGNYNFVPNEIYDRLYDQIFIFMDMYSRVSLHNSGNYNEFNIH